MKSCALLERLNNMVFVNELQCGHRRVTGGKVSLGTRLYCSVCNMMRELVSVTETAS